jgi:hypothetical protein
VQVQDQADEHDRQGDPDQDGQQRQQDGQPSGGGRGPLGPGRVGVEPGGGQLGPPPLGVASSLLEGGRVGRAAGEQEPGQGTPLGQVRRPQLTGRPGPWGRPCG